MQRFELIADDDPSTAFVDDLEQRLYDFNKNATGLHDGRGLSFACRNQEGELLGALSGHTWGGCCEIKQLWVAEQFRGRGLGRQLVETAEEEARRRGCGQIVLTTHSFQAPRFYVGLGFEIVAALDDYPAGHRQLTLRKKLLYG